MALPATRREGGAPAPGTARLLRERRAAISIRWIVSLAALALITASVLGVSAVTESNARRALTDEIQNRLMLEARNLALSSTEPLLADFPELALHPLVKAMKSRQPELALVLVLDHAGMIQGDPDARRLGMRFTPTGQTEPLPTTLALAADEQLVADGDVLVASAPVKHGDGRRIGTAMVGLRRHYLDDKLARARRQQMVALGVVLALGALAASLLMSLVLRPLGALRAGIERIGRGDLRTPLVLRDRTELGMLADTVNDMAAALHRAQAEMLERERLAHEVELASEIQSSLLPQQRTVAGEFVIQGSQRAAAVVGGDYYDFLVFPDGRVGVAVADVAGKGLAGCLVMSMLSALLRAYRATVTQPSELLAVLDERLSETLPAGSFVTMFYGVLDPAAGVLTYASAGHSPVLVCRAGRIEWTRTTGIPLGAVRGGAIRRTLRDDQLTLGPGDVLVQFTDGVNEAFDPGHREQFGFDRMEQVVRESAPRGCSAVIEALHDAVERWNAGEPRGDDETILVVSRERSGAGAAAPAPPPAAGAGAPPRPAAESAPPSAARTDDAAARELLARARSEGRGLTLEARLDALKEIRPWAASLYPAGTLSENRYQLLCTALHEACSNVVEHGSAASLIPSFELWWLPGPGSGGAGTGGAFVIRDHGIPFRADNWKRSDFSDPAVWRRGRGFGLDIIHGVMSDVTYHPGTPEGNLMVMCFETSDESQGELRHVR